MTTETMEDHLRRAAALAAGYSPAQESLFDDFTFNDHNDYEASSALPNTVSPSDLGLTGDDFTPALTNSQSFDVTPSLLDDTSPFMDSYETSPAFENFKAADSHFPPLFGADEELKLHTKKRKHAEPNIASSTESLTRPGAATMSRTSSSGSVLADTAAERESLRQRLALSGALPKSTRRQSRQLADIDVESGDEVAAKRAKNTLAARKSRQKKKDEVSLLEQKLLEVMEDRDFWKMQAIRHGAPIPSPSLSAATTPQS